MRKAKRIIGKRGGNQYVKDPRQADFLARYVNPKSKTFSNAYQSALLAGYEEEYAKTITAQMPDWLSDSIRDNNLLQKALKNLDAFLDDKEKIYKYKATELVTRGLHKSFRKEDEPGAEKPTPILALQINVHQSPSNGKDNGDEEADTRGSRRDSGEQDDKHIAILDSPGAE